MQKLKIFWTIIVFILITNLFFPVYADDETEEISITEEEIEEILETAVDLSKAPSINSRNAVCYDRTSRGSIIWKRRK